MHLQEYEWLPTDELFRQNDAVKYTRKRLGVIPIQFRGFSTGLRID